MCIEDTEETGNGVERGGKIGIPVADDLLVEVLDRMKESTTDRLGFPAVDRAAHDLSPVFETSTGLLEDFERFVLASVVNEDDADGIGTLKKAAEGGDIEPLRLVVTGDNDGDTAWGGRPFVVLACIHGRKSVQRSVRAGSGSGMAGGFSGLWKSQYRRGDAFLFPGQRSGQG